MSISGAAGAFLFSMAWCRNPFRVGALLPSGQSLARLITTDIVPAYGPVLELGPGTGVFTSALLQKGVAPEDLTLVELDSRFADLLSLRHPRARMLRMDASHLVGRQDLRRHAAAVSGLPLMSMSQEKVAGILAGVLHTLHPGGALYQFTYGLRCPVPKPVLEQLGLGARPTGRAWKNVPPATVYQITRTL